MLKFGSTIAAQLDETYNGADFARRRAASAELLRAAPGDCVLDIGSGAGHLTLELSRAVGPSGRVIGIDPSDDMRRTAAERCEGRSNVCLMEGTASVLPLDDASVDRAISIQVFEYLDDVPAALAEAHRVLRDGGRLVIGDTHFESLAWFSEEPVRMRSMAEAWDRHVHHQALPALLPRFMTDAGFEVEQVVPHTICDTVGRPDGLARSMMTLMTAYALKNGLVEEGEVRAWREEQERLIEGGRFFFSLTHYVVAARKR